MSTALVAGATGILGRAIVRELAGDSKKWSTIYALSRSKKEDYPNNVKHQHIDLTSDVSDMAKELEDIKPDYIFFAAYLEKKDAKELDEVNGKMLKNFLGALEKTGACKTVKRIILVTGAKQFGVHLGRVRVPMEESDPWLTGPNWPPNFYYTQQNILADLSKKHGSWDWVVTYPNDVIGVAKGNFMNLASSVGIYAAITKEMGTNLVFPGSPKFYNMFDSFTDASFHAQFCNWAATAKTASKQGFNVVNGDAQSWQRLWPAVAHYFGVKITKDQFKSGSNSGEMKLEESPPIAEQAVDIGLEGTDFTKQSAVEYHIDLNKWAAREDVKEAWEKMAERDGLDKDAFEKATWDFLTFVLGRNYDCVISMSKARKAGFDGYKDSWDALKEAFDGLKAENVLPN